MMVCGPDSPADYMLGYAGLFFIIMKIYECKQGHLQYETWIAGFTSEGIAKCGSCLENAVIVADTDYFKIIEALNARLEKVEEKLRKHTGVKFMQ